MWAKQLYKELFTAEVLQERRCAFGSISLTANLRCHLQVTRPAIERNEDKHAEYQIKVAEEYLPEQLVFVDESACNRNTTKREYAWAPINGRARRHDYFVWGKRYVYHQIVGLRQLNFFQLFYPSRSFTRWYLTSWCTGSFIHRRHFQLIHWRSPRQYEPLSYAKLGHCYGQCEHPQVSWTRSYGSRQASYLALTLLI